jgi:hypothetical protein
MSSIPNDLKRFILTSVPSVPHLEAALMMHAQPGVGRTAAEVAARLYVPEQVAIDLLQSLFAAGILKRDAEPSPRYRFEPGNPALDETLAALAQAYADDLVGVTKLIHDATQKNAQRFADAFKLRKDR